MREIEIILYFSEITQIQMFCTVKPQMHEGTWGIWGYFIFP